MQHRTDQPVSRHSSMDEYVVVITAENLVEDMLQKLLFASYLFSLFRLGESEYGR